jgi:hypothetical protein
MIPVAKMLWYAASVTDIANGHTASFREWPAVLRSAYTNDGFHILFDPEIVGVGYPVVVDRKAGTVAPVADVVVTPALREWSQTYLSAVPYKNIAGSKLDSAWRAMESVESQYHIRSEHSINIIPTDVLRTARGYRTWTIRRRWSIDQQILAGEVVDPLRVVANPCELPADDYYHIMAGDVLDVRDLNRYFFNIASEAVSTLALAGAASRLARVAAALGLVVWHHQACGSCGRGFDVQDADVPCVCETSPQSQAPAGVALHSLSPQLMLRISQRAASGYYEDESRGPDTFRITSFPTQAYSLMVAAYTLFRNCPHAGAWHMNHARFHRDVCTQIVPSLSEFVTPAPSVVDLSNTLNPTLRRRISHGID